MLKKKGIRYTIEKVFVRVPVAKWQSGGKSPDRKKRIKFVYKQKHITIAREKVDPEYDHILEQQKKLKGAIEHD